MSTLYYGDNLDILKHYVKDESVDLIYLDPPFNSNASYNVLFTDKKGEQSAAQLQAFKDTWSWAEAAMVYQELTLESGTMGDALRAFGALLPRGGMLAYLTMMAPRLRELRRVLKPTGSIYLHCDPTASHYLKVLMDSLFGVRNYRNEIIWKRTSSHNDAKRKYADVSDCLLFYSKTDDYRFAVQYAPYSEEYLKTFYRFTDEQGRRYRLSDLRSPHPRPNLTYDYKGYKPHPNGWAVNREKMEQLDAEGRLHYPKKQDGRIQLKRFLDEMPGMPVGNVWDDIQPVQAQADERLGYPTQKPEALLERIIRASSNECDVVLDPFCGCGTAIAVAERLKREWIGIDITQAAIQTIKARLESFGKIPYKIVGEPVSVNDAQQLADENPYQFQWWALGLVGARPEDEKKGADKGIDGKLYFYDGAPKQIIISVKGGQHVSSNVVSELVGVVKRENAAIGVLITMKAPTKPMIAEAASAGFYQSQWGKHPKIQILTIAELLAGKRIDYPNVTGANVTYKQAPKAKGDDWKQHELPANEGN